MWRRVGHVRTDVSEERTASIFNMEVILELGTVLTVTSRLNLTTTSRILPALKIEATRSY
jgi:hypothetical protein